MKKTLSVAHCFFDSVEDPLGAIADSRNGAGGDSGGLMERAKVMYLPISQNDLIEYVKRNARFVPWWGIKSGESGGNESGGGR